MKQITAFCTDLTTAASVIEKTEVGISSLVDTWLLLQTIEASGERNRALYILKSRGMHHSNQVREFILSNEGIQLRNVYVGPSGVLTGSARIIQEEQDMAEALEHKQAVERKQREVEQKKALVESQIAVLRAQYQSEKDDLQILLTREKEREAASVKGSLALARSRQADDLHQEQKTGKKPGKGARS